MRKQDAWPPHAAFMDQLVSEAFVVLGGPISGDDSRIMLIVDCAEEREVRTRLADDPWTNWACSASPAWRRGKCY